MKRLFSYIKPYGWFILLTVSIKFLATVAELFIPSLMETIIDEKVPGGELAPILILGGAMLLCAAVSLGGNILANRMSATSAGHITKALRHDLFSKLENLSARQIDELTVSSAVSRLTSDSYNFNQMVARIQRMGIRAPILLVGGVMMMVMKDWKLALVLIALMPILSFVVIKATQKALPLRFEAQGILDDMVQVSQENITGIRVIKALSKSDYEKGRFDRVNKNLSATILKADLYTITSNPATNLLLNIGLTMVVLVGAYRVNADAIKPGVIIAFLQYFNMILMATMGITRIFIMWAKGEASAQRIADVLATEPELQVEAGGQPQQGAPHIEFKNVTFSYTGVGANVEDLSFRLEHGQTLGILGATGSGKSTVINLLLRFYDPDKGQILIDGQDIKTVDYETLRNKFGVVFQNDFVTEGTIAHNLRFFRELDTEDLNRAARDAQGEFIWDKEGQMEAEVAIRGNNLSGGQKQRLLIGRALAGDPEILILDDASSALDYQTDANLRRALRENYRNTTTVLVAQRISSLQHADLILVLEEGKVIGAGTHPELLQNCEEYRIIAQTQMGEGKEGA